MSSTTCKVMIVKRVPPNTTPGSQTGCVHTRAACSAPRTSRRSLRLGAHRLLRGLAQLALAPSRPLRVHPHPQPQPIQRRSAPRRDSASLPPAAENRLRQHDWPGNVRELRNVILRAALLNAATRTGCKCGGAQPPSSATDNRELSGQLRRRRQLHVLIPVHVL